MPGSSGTGYVGSRVPAQAETLARRTRHIALRATLVLEKADMVRLLHASLEVPSEARGPRDRGPCFTRASRRYSTVADVLVLVFSSTLTAGDSASVGTSAD